MNQRQQWASLKRCIETTVARVKSDDFSTSLKSLYSVNIVRGQGLFCRAVMKHILRNTELDSKFSSLILDINAKFPEIGELLVGRLTILFKKEYRRNSWEKVNRIIKFLCELTVQNVVDGILLLQILQVLLDQVPTEDDIRIACIILLAASEHLNEVAVSTVIDRMRELLQQGQVSTVSQRGILVCLRKRRDAIDAQTASSSELRAIGEIHLFDLTQQIDPQSNLNYYHYDDRFDENELTFNHRLLHDPLTDEKNHPEHLPHEFVMNMTNDERLQEQKTIYLTIMSSMSPDEAVHKLLKLQKKERMEYDDFLGMVVKCCASEKTYSKFFGVLSDKICRQSTGWARAFITRFRISYDTLSQYEGSQLRNIGKLFGHLIAADSLPMAETLGRIVLTEQETSSAGRIFLKFLFQEMVEELGIEELSSNLQNESEGGKLRGLFPMAEGQDGESDHLLFSINYFTAIGLGILTERMRKSLKDIEASQRGRTKIQGNHSRPSNPSYSASRSNSRYNSHDDSHSESRSRSFSRSRSPPK